MSIHDSIHKVSKGFAYERSGYKVDGTPGIFATYDEAETAARDLADRKAATTPVAQPAPKAAPVVADRQAMRVGGMVADLGITAPAPQSTGRCHYCGQRLDRRGYCDECN